MKRLFNGLILLALLVLPLSCNTAQQPEEVNLSAFIEEGTIDGDHTLAFRNALEYCKNTGASKLIIPAGDYSLFPDYAFEKYQYVSNNTAALKRRHPFIIVEVFCPSVEHKAVLARDLERL